MEKRLTRSAPKFTCTLKNQSKIVHFKEIVRGVRKEFIVLIYCRSDYIPLVYSLSAKLSIYSCTTNLMMSVFVAYLSL